MKVKFIDVQGISTRYYQEGDFGEPLLLIHGIGVSSDLWFRNIDALGVKHRVFAPDLLGHGFTDAVDLEGCPPHARTVDHLRAFADAVDVHSFNVVGSSFGGLIAALLYLSMPERISRLGIVSSGSTVQTAEEQVASFQKTKANALNMMQSATLDSCRQRLANIHFRDSTVPEEVLLAQLTMYARPDTVRYFAQALEALACVEAVQSHSLYHRMEELTVPTLMMVGRDDPRVRLERVVEAASRVPDSKLLVFDECGHQPQLEHPTHFNAAIDRFLTTHA